MYHGESNMETCIIKYKIYSQWKSAVWFRELKLSPYNNLDLRKHMADSCWCLVETNTIR